MTTENEILRRAEAVQMIATASPETRPYVAQFPLLVAAIEALGGDPVSDRERLIFLRMCDELDTARRRYERDRARSKSLPEIPVVDSEGRIPEAMWALAAAPMEAAIRECEEAWAGIEEAARAARRRVSSGRPAARRCTRRRGGRGIRRSV